MEPVIATTVADPFEGDIVVAMLKSVGITAALRPAGRYYPPLGGVASTPMDIMVPAEQLADARELLAQASRQDESGEPGEQT